MMRSFVVVLAGLALAASAVPADRAVPDPLVPSAGADGLVQLQHELAVPETIFGVWIAVRGAPGTAYELFLRRADGTRTRIDHGVVPAWGQLVKAWWMPHRDVDQSTTRGELWSVSDAPLAAHVELLD